MASTELTVVSQPVPLETRGGVRPQDLMPVLDLAMAIQRRNFMLDITKQLMIAGTDFGIIPGTPKPTLYKAGAERLCSLFGFTPEFVEDKIIEDWTGAQHGGEPLFHYSYRCRLIKNGIILGEGIGSCNTWESKYRYRWVAEDQIPLGLDKASLPKRGGVKRVFEPDFAIEKAETGGKYGKPAEYWQRFQEAIEARTAERGQKQMGQKTFQGWWLQIDEVQFRCPNPDICDQVNTAQKMAQKRAFVAATLIATNASEFYTQDLEDMQSIDVPFTRAEHDDTPKESRDEAASRRIAEERSKASSQPPQQQKPGPVMQAAAEAKQAVEDSEELRKIIAAASSRQGITDSISALCDRLSSIVGEERSVVEFNRVLDELHITDWTKQLLNSVNNARQFLRKFYWHVEGLADAAKPTPAEVSAAEVSAPAALKGDHHEISDDDLPPILQGGAK